MSQPAEISHEKEAMPQHKKRKVVKVIKRKVATPQEGQTLPASARPEAPPSGPTALQKAHDHLTTQLVSPEPARAEQATHEQADAAARPEQVSPPSAPAAAKQVSAPTAAAPHPAPETATEATQPAPTELPARPAAPAAPVPRVNERAMPRPTTIPAKAEPATPGSAVNVKHENTGATSSIPSKQEPMTAKRHRAVEQAKQDNMQRCSTQSQLGSPAGPSTPMPSTNASQPSRPATGAAPPVARGPPAAHPAAPAQPPQATAAGQAPADSEDGRSNHDDDDTGSVGGHSSTTSFSHALERGLNALLENPPGGGEGETRRNEDNRNTAQPAQPAIPRRRRQRTVEEKAIHAKFMRFTRHIQSFLSY